MKTKQIFDQKFQFMEKSDELDSFWGGVDEYGAHKYELFFQGDFDDPSPAQLECYDRLKANMEPLLKRIESDAKAKLADSDPKLHAKVADSTSQIDIINVTRRGSDHDVEVCCNLSYRKLIFTRTVHVSGKVKDNQVVSTEIM